MSQEWRDPKRMHELYVERGLSIKETAKEIGCSPGTISNWLPRHGIEAKDIGAHYSDDAVVLVESELRRLYLEKGLSTYEIGDRCNVSPKSVWNWLDEYGIETRKPNYERMPPFETKPDDGYERWRHYADGKRVTVFVHRLLAVAEYGLEEIRDKSVHHENNIPWDNRPSNITPMDPIEHRRMHNLEGYKP